MNTSCRWCRIASPSGGNRLGTSIVRPASGSRLQVSVASAVAVASLGLTRMRRSPTAGERAAVEGAIGLGPGRTESVREKKPKPLADPKVAAAARELRDKYLEQAHAGAFVIEPGGKYLLDRRAPESTAALAAPVAGPAPSTPLLAA